MDDGKGLTMRRQKRRFLERKLTKYRKVKKITSFDVETTGLSPWDEATEIFSYCIGDYDTGEVEVCRMDDCSKRRRRYYLDKLRDYFLDTSVAKIAHRYKFEYAMLNKHQIVLPEDTIWHDTLLMSQLLNNRSRRHALDWVSWELGGYPRDLDIAVKKQGDDRGGYRHVDKPLMYDYQIADGERPLLLFDTFKDDLENDEKLYLDYLNEIELVKTTYRLESYGIRLHWGESNKLITYLEDELEKTQEAATRFLGEVVNLNSSQQVQRLLFKRFRYPVIIYNEETGEPSTDKNVLNALKERYDNPIFDLILKTRSYSNGLAHLRSYQAFADKNGIIRPNINTNDARTGRQTSDHPNMQNVEKDKAGEGNPFPVPARQVFWPKPGHVLFLVDYAGIELRLIIEAGQSYTMMKILRDGGNPHVVACKIFDFPGCPHRGSGGITCDKSCGLLYNYAKNSHFCLCYGGGLTKFAATAHLKNNEAKKGYNAYGDAFPELAYLTTTIAQRVRETGYVETPFGRKLRLPRDKAYVGLNYMIQGTAAGVLKRAQVNVDRYLQKEWDDKVRMLLPIHDEIIISVPRTLLSEKDEILRNVSRIMVDMPEINVPLAVEWKKTTSSWARAKGYEVAGL